MGNLAKREKSNTPTGMRVLMLDIETLPGLAYLFDSKPRGGFVPWQHFKTQPRVACWAAVWYGSEEVIFRSEFHHGRRKMLEKLWTLLDRATHVVHYNGDRFDIPKIMGAFKQAKTRGGIEPGFFKSVDLFKIARRYGAMSRSLEYLATNVLELSEGKVKHEGFPLWMRCYERDPEAWDQMRAYNIGDVFPLLVNAYDEMRPQMRGAVAANMFVTPGHPSCAVCGNAELRWTGTPYRTDASEYPAYLCHPEDGGCGYRGAARLRTRGVSTR